MVNSVVSLLCMALTEVCVMKFLDEVRLLAGASEEGGKVYQNGGKAVTVSNAQFNDLKF